MNKPREKSISVEIAEPIAPDGGYGWLVVGAAFFAHVITHGILYSFGVTFITIQEKYGGRKADVSWILSIATGMLYLIGPVAGYLSERFGIKLVTILGTCLGSCGYLMSMFVTNLPTLYVTIGFVTGCGFGMVFLGAIVIVTMYFDKRRSLASGMALSGAGSGVFIFSPLIKTLLSTYSWNGTLLILSGIILNCLVCGLIFRPITSYKVKKHPSLQTYHAVNAKEDVLEEKVAEFGEAEKVFIEIDNQLEETNRTVVSTEVTDNDISNASNKKYCEKEIGMKEHDTVKESSVLGVNNDSVIDDASKLEEYSDDGVQQEYNLTNSDRGSTSNSVNCARFSYSGDVTVKFLSGEDRSNNTTSYVDNKLCNFKMWSQTLSNQFDLFRSKVFVIFVISQFLFFLGFYQPFFYIPDRAKQKGIPQDISVWAVSSIGISSILGRVVLGYIADRPSVNRMVIFQAALFVAGISTSLGPLLDSVWSLFVYAILYGISTGIVLSLTAVLLSDLMGIGRLANAFGINNFFCGTASLMGPPLAGFLYDVSGSYNLSFIVAGLFITTSGMLMLLTYCVKSNHTRNTK